MKKEEQKIYLTGIQMENNKSKEKEEKPQSKNKCNKT